MIGHRLVEIINNIGFNTTVKEPFESNIDDIILIEQKSRTKNSVIVEGRKL